MNQTKIFFSFFIVILLSPIFIWRQDLSCFVNENSTLNIKNIPLKCWVNIHKKSFEIIDTTSSANIWIFHDTNNLYFAYFNWLFYDIQYSKIYEWWIFSYKWGSLWQHKTQNFKNTAFFVNTSGGKITELFDFEIKENIYLVWIEKQSSKLWSYYSDKENLYYIFIENWNTKIQTFSQEYKKHLDNTIPITFHEKNEVVIFGNTIIKNGEIFPINYEEVLENQLLWIESVDGTLENSIVVPYKNLIFWKDKNYVYDIFLNTFDWLNPEKTLFIGNWWIISDGKKFYDVLDDFWNHYSSPKEILPSQELFKNYQSIQKIVK